MLAGSQMDYPCNIIISRPPATHAILLVSGMSTAGDTISIDPCLIASHEKGKYDVNEVAYMTSE